MVYGVKILLNWVSSQKQELVLQTFLFNFLNICKFKKHWPTVKILFPTWAFACPQPRKMPQNEPHLSASRRPVARSHVLRSGGTRSAVTGYVNFEFNPSC